MVDPSRTEFVGVGGLETPRQSEVQHLHGPGFRHDQIARFDVAVDDALGVCRAECAGDLHAQVGDRDVSSTCSATCRS